MAYTGTGVVSYGFPIDAFTFTYFISGLTDTDAAHAAAAGLAVALDDTAENTVKLAGDGDPIFGRIFVAERRDVLGVSTASIQRKFKEKLPAAASHGITVGDSVVGDGAGLVRLVASGTPAEVTAGQRNIVVEVGDEFVVVEQL